MNYIVFDLEWNQCPDGKIRENPAIPFEVLEIGAVKLNEDKQEVSRFHELIRPVVYRRLHPMTQSIIHLSLKELESADHFVTVCENFHQWCGSDAVFCTWGSLDLLELQRNMRFHKMENFFPFPLKYLDIQKLYSIYFDDGKSRKSLETAIDELQLSKTDSFHAALSDAVYTAEILKLLPAGPLQDFYSIDYFRSPQNRKEEIYVIFDGYSKFVSKEFASKKDIMKDRKVTSTRCYLCGKNAKKKIRWFASGGKNFSCLAYCEEHGYLKGKIRLKKCENAKGFFCVKTIKQIDVDRAGDLLERKLILQERRRLKRHHTAAKESS